MQNCDVIAQLCPRGLRIDFAPQEKKTSWKNAFVFCRIFTRVQEIIVTGLYSIIINFLHIRDYSRVDSPNRILKLTPLRNSHEKQVLVTGFQCHFSHLVLCLTIWHPCTTTSALWSRHSLTCTHTRTRSLCLPLARVHTHAQIHCWTLKPCDRHVHLFKHCPDRRKTLAIISPLWTCPSLSLWISGAELILPPPLGPVGLDLLSLAPHIAVRSPNWQPAAEADSSLLALLWAAASNLRAGSGWPPGIRQSIDRGNDGVI